MYTAGMSTRDRLVAVAIDALANPPSPYVRDNPVRQKEAAILVVEAIMVELDIALVPYRGEAK
jgi:hypothetical protein